MLKRLIKITLSQLLLGMLAVSIAKAEQSAIATVTHVACTVPYEEVWENWVNPGEVAAEKFKERVIELLRQKYPRATYVASFASGGESYIFEVRQLINGKEQVSTVSVPRNLNSARSHTMYRTQRETAVASKKADPAGGENLVNIIRVMELGDEKIPAMEVKKGADSLDRMLSHYGPLTEKRKMLRAFRGIAKGLDAMHAANLVHRDLKPSNIILYPDEFSGEMVPKIADFGLSSGENEYPPGMRAISGTPEYMDRHQEKDGRGRSTSDLHALKLIFYEMVAGISPYKLSLAPRNNIDVFDVDEDGRKRRFRDIPEWAKEVADPAVLRILKMDFGDLGAVIAAIDRELATP